MTNRHVWSFVSTTSSDNDDTPNVFVFQKVIDEVDGTHLGDFFLCIASIDQMEALKYATEADPLYLKNIVEVDARSDDEREVMIGNIDYAIDMFNENMEAWGLLKESEVYNIQ